MLSHTTVLPLISSKVSVGQGRGSRNESGICQWEHLSKSELKIKIQKKKKRNRLVTEMKRTRASGAWFGIPWTCNHCLKIWAFKIAWRFANITHQKPWKNRIQRNSQTLPAGSQESPVFFNSFVINSVFQPSLGHIGFT